MVYYIMSEDLFFQHTFKAAGTSMIRWIEKAYPDDHTYCGADMYHISNRNWKRSFTTIRNPYDRLVSMYKNLVLSSKIRTVVNTQPLITQHYILLRDGYSGEYTFSDFVDRVVALKDFKFNYVIMCNARKSNYENLNDKLHQINMEFHWNNLTCIHTLPMTHSWLQTDKFKDILRFENLQNDFTEFLVKYDFEPSVLVYDNVTWSEPYQGYYDNRTRDKVAEYYKEDLLTFDYKF